MQPPKHRQWDSNIHSPTPLRAAGWPRDTRAADLGEEQIHGLPPPSIVDNNIRENSSPHTLLSMEKTVAAAQPRDAAPATTCEHFQKHRPSLTRELPPQPFNPDTVGTGPIIIAADTAATMEGDASSS